MKMMLLDRPDPGERLMPLGSHRIVTRMRGLAHGVTTSVDLDPRHRHSYLAGCVVLPFAHFAIGGTACERPLYLAEGEKIASATQLDFVLLRFDPCCGASFDVWLRSRTDWLCNYVAWHCDESGLWLIPAEGSGPFLLMADSGIECETRAPFLHPAQRDCGIMRALTSPSF